MNYLVHGEKNKSKFEYARNIIVSEFEKRGNFAQNAIFCHFLAYHHFKPVRALGFRLDLQAVWTFYFTDPTLEARASLLSRAV
ncbi:MAG: hypothetical protein MJE68_18825, partial [Proteobacteria bacterium]|nr:hypothetical protein [Pseudomonadota bacterium]